MTGCDAPACPTPQPARPYACGNRCDTHRPGPPPLGRYCAPNRCYCGACPSWSPHATYVDNIERNVVDARAIASGRRRASIESYRAAQQTLAAQKGR